MSFLYLDHAAATPLYPEVQAVLQELLGKDLGNPSSIHARGRETKQYIDEARYACAKLFRTSLDGVIFTSGATEGAHLAIVGGAIANSQQPIANSRLKILLSPLVHKSIWGAVGYVEKHFGVGYDLLPLKETGHIDVKALEEMDLEAYRMIVCEHGNSECGHVQPVAKIGRMLEKCEGEKPLLVVDAAASLVSETVSLEHLKCDILFFSGEKIGGPGGVGAVIKREGVVLSPVIGGAQEFGVRGGTENVVGIVGLRVALEERSRQYEEGRTKWKTWHKKMREVLQGQGMAVTTPEKDYLPHIIHFLHPTMKASLFVQQMDLQGVGLSAGSACSSGTVEGSKTLQMLGYSEEESQRGVRVSWGWNTSETEIDKAIEAMQRHNSRAVNQ